MKRLLYVALVALLLQGCYPAGPEYVEDLDVVYTTYDKEYDFQAANTYAMPDKIVVDVEIDNGDTTYVYMKPVFATPILNAIRTEMTSNGWNEVLPQNADVIITPAALSSTTYFYSYWYDWWYGYGGWYGGYWGWYYPPYYTVSSYTTGSLVLVMADPSAADDSPINRSPAIWSAVANGLYTGSYDVSRVENGIEQAFKQSPYLKIN